MEEGDLLEDLEVWVWTGVLGGWETAADEDDADAATDEADEAEDSDGPAVADALEEAGEHERVDDTTDASGC